MRATRAIIHLDRFSRNIGAVRQRIGPGPLICIPVKADAYGHGALRIAQAALEAGAEYLAAATVQEGAELREGGINAPLLLLSVPLPGELPETAALGLIPLITDRELAVLADRAAAAAGVRLTVHLKIDTGMGRVGCRPEEAADLAIHIAALKHLEYGGTATHLAAADSTGPDDIRYTGEQLTRFREAVETIKAAGINPGIVHAANSGAVVLREDAYFDMVRPGILVYGYPPVADPPRPIPVEPVMELTSHIVFIKELKKGEAVSYGRTWIAGEDTVIGTIPVGYGDGLPRLLSGNHPVFIRGKAYPLVGRICMDQCMVDLGPRSGIERWEPVTVFGGPAPSAADIAAQLHTIPYEITCNINKRVPRMYSRF